MEQWNSGRGVVYLKLDIDGADGKALHPYPWIPPTGNVMYCMPQEGTEAYLYFQRQRRKVHMQSARYIIAGVRSLQMRSVGNL